MLAQPTGVSTSPLGTCRGCPGMPHGYHEKVKCGTGEPGGVERAAGDSKVFARGPFDAADDLDVVLAKHHAQVSGFLSAGAVNSSRVQAQLQERASASQQQHVGVVLGILYGLLADYPSRSRHLALLRAVTRDNHAALIGTLHKLCLEKWLKLKQDAKQALLWLIEQLLFDLEVNDAEVLLLCLVRQMASGDLSESNLWLVSQLLAVLNSHRIAVYHRPHILTGSLFSFLRLLADHVPCQRPVVKALAGREIAFCVMVLRERFSDCLVIGRDLLRLLQDVSSVPEIQAVWRDLLLRPESFGVPAFTDIRQLYATRTPTRFIACRVTPEMEQQLRFLLTHVQMGEQRRYQTWFSLKYLVSTESESLVSDLIRFICCVIHPTNQILQSNVIPRWAVIGWLLKCCRSAHVESNAKLSLFFDWLFFSPAENVMNIEPAVLCIFYSLPKYPELSNSLLEFLFLLLDHYDENRGEVLLQGVRNAVDVLVGKGVIPNLQHLSEHSHIPPRTRERIQATFPRYCAVKPSAGPRDQGKLKEVKQEELSAKVSEGHGREQAASTGKDAMQEIMKQGDGEFVGLKIGAGTQLLAALPSEIVISQQGQTVIEQSTSEIEKPISTEHTQNSTADQRKPHLSLGSEKADVSELSGDSDQVSEEELDGDGGSSLQEEGADDEDTSGTEPNGDPEAGDLLDSGSSMMALVSWGYQSTDEYAADVRLKRRRLTTGPDVLGPTTHAVGYFKDHMQRLRERIREACSGSSESAQAGAAGKANGLEEAASNVEEHLLDCIATFIDELLEAPSLSGIAESRSEGAAVQSSEFEEELAGEVEDSGPPKRRRTGDLHGCKPEVSGTVSRLVPPGKGGLALDADSSPDLVDKESPAWLEFSELLLEVAHQHQIPLFCAQTNGSSSLKRDGVMDPGQCLPSQKLRRVVSKQLCSWERRSIISLLLGKHLQMGIKKRWRVPIILQHLRTQNSQVTAWVLWLVCQLLSQEPGLRTQSRGDLPGDGNSRVHPEADVTYTPDDKVQQKDINSKLLQVYLDMIVKAEGSNQSNDDIAGEKTGDCLSGMSGQPGEAVDRSGTERKISALRKRKRVKSIEALTAAPEFPKEDLSVDAPSCGTRDADKIDRGETPMASPPRGGGGMLQQIVSDVETCLLHVPESPQTILPVLLHHLAQVCSCNSRLLHILVASLDPVQLSSLEMQLSLGIFSLTGLNPSEAEFRHLLEDSASWDWAEQEWLWRLLLPEAGRWNEKVWLALLGGLRSYAASAARRSNADQEGESTLVNPDAGGADSGMKNCPVISPFLLAGLKSLLSIATPTSDLLEHILTLPSDVLGVFPAVVIQRWATQDPHQLGSLLRAVDVQLDKQSTVALVEFLRMTRTAAETKEPLDGTEAFELLAMQVEKMSSSLL